MLAQRRRQFLRGPTNMTFKNSQCVQLGHVAAFISSLGCALLVLSACSAASIEDSSLSDPASAVSSQALRSGSNHYAAVGLAGSAAPIVEVGLQRSGHGRHHGSCCGDGTRQGAEQCDDGNLSDGDGCSATCSFDDNTQTVGDDRPGYMACGVSSCTTTGEWAAAASATAFASVRMRRAPARPAAAMVPRTVRPERFAGRHAGRSALRRTGLTRAADAAAMSMRIAIRHNFASTDSVDSV
jgi:cysteine-rich repeat protein